MKYFIVESIMREELPCTPAQMAQIYVPAHEAYLHEGIDAGMLLMAGPCDTGGFMLLRAERREEIDAFLAKEPFHTNGFNEFRVKEFDPRDRAEQVKDW